MSFSGTVKDAKGNPLAGITVTDGRNLAKTDAEGKYFLPGWERARVISVCALTLRDDDWYKSADSKDFDFCLHPAENGEDFCFLHTSDTEIDGREDCGWLDFVRKQVKKHSPAFIVDTGDICNMDGLVRHHYLLNKESAGCPVRYTIGNHDFAGPEYGEQTYEKYFGPTWYSFDCGKMHFVAVSYGKGDVKSGYETDDQWIWLRNDLEHFKPEALTILSHRHCRCEEEESFEQETGDGVIALRDHSLKAWVFGHLHSNFAHEHTGVLNVCTACPDQGGIDSSEAGLRKISVRGDKVTTKMLYNAPAARGGEKGSWQTVTDGFCIAPPVLSDGRLFVSCFDDGYPKKCGVTCIDEKSGKALWKFPTPDGVKGSVTLYGKKVFFQDTKCTLYALDKNTGKLLYSAKFRVSQPMFTRNSPIIADSLLIAGNPANVIVLDPETGKELRRLDGLRSESTIAGFVWDPFRKQLIVNSHWRALRAVDPNDCRQIWRKPDVPIWFRSSPPLVTEKALYTCGYNKLVSVDPLTGEFIAVSDPGCVADSPEPPALHDGVLYFPTGSGGVKAVDPETLEVMWGFDAGEAKIFPIPYLYGKVQTVCGTPKFLGGTLIFTSADGGLYFYDLKTRRRIKRTELGAPSLCSPVLTENSIITADFYGRITKFSL
ncbi:MAG: PQQ-binding-like beta-propeller repeat protein [Clostridia bacterium]|nr:PQQ-binding-like beta-propeller repeat protein [Clostridia bacterium]